MRSHTVRQLADALAAISSSSRTPTTTTSSPGGGWKTLRSSQTSVPSVLYTNTLNAVCPVRPGAPTSGRRTAVGVRFEARTFMTRESVARMVRTNSTSSTTGCARCNRERWHAVPMSARMPRGTATRARCLLPFIRGHGCLFRRPRPDGDARTSLTSTASVGRGSRYAARSSRRLRL